MFLEFIEQQQAWREAKAEEYPDDRRNQQSVEALASFAKYIQGLEADGPGGENWAALDRLQPHMSGGVILGGERTARELSRYGFGYGVTEGTHEEFLADLWNACMEDAYDYAREHEIDWTDALWPAEVDAAKADIALPFNYWQRRPKLTEPEIEAELNELIVAAAEKE